MFPRFLIENGQIIAINPASVPSTATIIKKPNLILLPGLMDMHVHLPNDFNQQFALQLVQDDDAMSTVRGVRNAKLLLMAGFTTVRNLGLTSGESFVDVALSKASEAGWIVAPHIIPAGHALSITGGHLDPDMFGPFAPNVLSGSYRTGIADGVDEVIKSVRYQIKHGAKVTPYVAFLLNALPKRNEWVFSSLFSSSGRVTDPNIAHTKACNVAGLYVSLHGLRRSFASLCEWTEVQPVLLHKYKVMRRREFVSKTIFAVHWICCVSGM